MGWKTRITRLPGGRWAALAAAGFWILGVPPQPAFADTARFEICGSGKRHTCIVDGDTVWLRGEKIRLEGIDAPELSRPGCRHEAALAAEARSQLAVILNSNRWVLTRNGKDRYGRTLGRFHIGKGTAGGILVKAGLARVWTGRRMPWC